MGEYFLKISILSPKSKAGYEMYKLTVFSGYELGYFQAFGLCFFYTWNQGKSRYL